MKKYELSTYQKVDKFFGTDYKRILCVILSPKYKKVKQDVKAYYKSIGFDIPDRGFKNHLEYSTWENNIFMIKDSVRSVREILEIFKLDVTNRIYKDVVHEELYFDRILDKPLFPYILFTSQDNCYIQIFPWTTREDLANNLSLIKKTFGMNVENTAINDLNITRYSLSSEGNKCYVHIFPWTTEHDIFASFGKIKQCFTNELNTFQYSGKRIRDIDTLIQNIELYWLYNDLQKKNVKGKELLTAMYEHNDYKQIVKKYNLSEEHIYNFHIHPKISDFNELLKDLDLF